MASEYQKRLIKESQARAKAGITMSNDPRRKSSGSSSSGSKSSPSSKTIVIYDSQGKVTQSNDPSKPVGMVDTSKIKESSLKNQPNYIGKSVVFKRTGNKIERQIFGAKGLESTKTLDTKKTTSQLARETSGIRKAQQSMAFREAEKKVLEGTANAKDLINYASFGTGKVRNILANKQLNEYVRSQVEYDNFRREVAKQLTPEQKAFANTLPRAEQDKYLLQVASRRKQPITKIEEVKKQKLTKTKQLSKVSNVISSKLESWGRSIERRDSASKKKEAEKEAKRIADLIRTKEDIDKIFPTGTKSVSKFLVSLSSKSIQLGKDFTIGYIKDLAKAGEKAIFLLPALGQSISRGDIKRFGKEFASPEQKQVLKEIYTDPKTYAFALIGAGIATALGGVRSGKLTAKTVKKIPKRTTKFKARTILKDGSNNLGYVTKSGLVKPVPKGFRAVTRALTRDVREFTFRNVKAFPKTSNARVGTVYRNLKGELRIVTKGGKVVKPKPKQARLLVKEFRKGAKARAKKTETARLTKKALKKPLKGKEAKTLRKATKLKATKTNLKKISSESNKFIRQFKLKGKDLTEFKRLYKSYRLKPTKLKAKRLERFAERIEVDRGVTFLDKLIKKELPKKRVRVKKPKKATKKVKAKPKPTEKELIKSEQFQARIKVDKQAQAKGFKDYAEEFKYSKIKKAFDRGEKGSSKAMRDITRKIKARKSKASKNRAKLIERSNDLIVKEARTLLREGKIAIKTKVGKTKLKRPKYSKEDTERVLRAIATRESRIKNKKARAEAIEVIKKGLVKEDIEGLSLRGNSALRQLLNKEQIKLLRLNKLKRISEGKVKGKQIKTRLSKAKRKSIIKSKKEAVRKARLERKKIKRSPAGDKQARKIRRKQIRDEINSLERIIKGDAKIPEGYTLEITINGYKLVPKKSVIPKSKRIKSARDILKKSKPKQGEIKSIGKDGTIQVLKTIGKKETRPSLSQRKLVLKKTFQKLRQQAKKQKTKQRQLIKKPIPKKRTITKTKTRLKRTRVKSKPQVLKSLKVARATSITGAVALANSTINKSKRKLVLAQNRFQGLEPVSLTKLAKDLQKALDKLNALDKDLSNLQDLGTDLTNLQDKAIKQDQRELNKLTEVYEQVIKKIKKKRTEKKTEKKPPVVPPLPKLNWNTKLPRGYSFIVNARYKKGNKILNRRLNTTPNRARKVMNKFIDNNPQASYDLVVVGAKKVKDIKKPSMKKFTIRKGKDPKVRISVEKNKYRLDKPTEKAISRRRRSAKKRKVSVKRKVTKRKTSKRTSKRKK